MPHRLVLTGAMLAHLAFIGFVVLGGFLAYWWPGLVLPHLAATAWAVWVLGLRRACPLTVAENWARAGAGLPSLPDAGFIAYYLDGRLYPTAWARRMPAVAFGSVALSWVLLVLR